MYIFQEIYYITTGSYKHRKSCYLVAEVRPGLKFASKVQVMTKEQLERFNTQVGGMLMELPSLRVTPSQFKEYEKQLTY